MVAVVQNFRDAFRYFVLKSDWEKLDPKLLKSLEKSSEEADVLKTLKALQDSYPAAFEYQAPLPALFDKLDRFQKGINSTILDDQFVRYMSKLDVFDEIARSYSHCDVDGGLSKLIFEAMRLRLSTQLNGTFEIVPTDNFYLAVRTFTNVLKKDSSSKLAVASWTIDKIYEQFASFYDKTQDRKALADLRQRLTALAKEKPPKKHPAWYSKAFKRHKTISDALKTTIESHPITFRSYSKNKKLVKTQLPIIRKVRNGTDEFHFNKDVENVILIALRNKGKKPKEISIRVETAEDQRNGLVMAITPDKFIQLLKANGLELSEIKVVEQKAARFDETGPVFVSPFGLPCVEFTHVFSKMIFNLVHGLKVWQCIQKEDVQKISDRLCKKYASYLPPDCNSRCFIEIPDGEKFIDTMCNEMKPLLTLAPFSPLPKAEFGYGFTEEVVREVVLSNLCLAAFFPNIEKTVHDAFWRVARRRPTDYLTQFDLMKIVSYCIEASVLKEMEKADDIRKEANKSVSLAPSSQCQFRSPLILHPLLFVTEIVRFPELAVKEEGKLLGLKERETGKRYFTNKIAKYYVFAILLSRFQLDVENPEQGDVYELDDVRLFYLSEKEILEFAEQKTDEFRVAIDNIPEGVEFQKTRVWIFREFLLKVAESLVNLEMFMKYSPGRTIILRTVETIRLESSEASSVFTTELLEALDVLIAKDSFQMTASQKEYNDLRRRIWRRDPSWSTVPVSELLHYLKTIPLDGSRLMLVPDARDLCHIITKPLVKCKKPFVSVIESPLYKTCSSIKRLHCCTVLSTVCELEDVIDIMGGDEPCSNITADLVKSAKANCMNSSWIIMRRESSTTVNIDTISEEELIPVAEAASSKALESIVAEADLKTQRQIKFLSVIFKNEPDIRRMMAEEMTFGAFEDLKDREAFRRWSAEGLLTPPPRPTSVQNRMKWRLENEDIFSFPKMETEEGSEETCLNTATKKKKTKKEKKEQHENQKDTEKKQNQKTKDEGLHENMNSKEEAPEKLKGKTISEKVDELIVKAGQLCDDCERGTAHEHCLANSMTAVLSDYILGELGPRTTVNADANAKTRNDLEAMRKQVAEVSGELLTLQEKFETVERTLKERKWEKELFGLHKTLAEKNKQIAKLEDENETFRNEMQSTTLKLKHAETERNNLKVQLKNDETYWLEKMKTINDNSRKCAQLEEQERIRRETEENDSQTIRQLRIENEQLKKKNRELSLKLQEFAAWNENVDGIRQIKEGLQKLDRIQLTPVRSSEMTAKLTELERIKQRLEDEKMMGRAIMMFSTFKSSSTDPIAIKRAGDKLVSYRQNYHKFVLTLNGNIRLIKQDLTAKLSELAPMYEYPKPFVLDEEVLPHKRQPEENSDSECMICLSDIGKNEETTRCDVCQKAFHASCVSQWLKQNSICPQCRSILPDPAEFPPLS